ncbi:AEC family transporter [Cellulosilyticum sp. I15G10I2]|uniref:AEC family transporter n=1 Tax=Cellulosilyticum sp. I15G10I2 TaxID=1892843 RepID=UPI00085C8C24|nr:AEC family transporter [Cellulosilyticum sp. I15G10I2]
MELRGVYTQLGVLFLLIFFGYILGKIKVITSAGIEAFSKFIVKVALPALIISGMMIPLTSEKLYNTMYILMLSIPTYGLAYCIAIGFSKAFIKDLSQRGVYRFAIVFSNAGFMGYPVLGAMFGKEAIFYTAVYNIMFNVLLYTLGIKLLKIGNNEKNKFDFKLLINPGVVASIIGLILFISGLEFPDFLTQAIDYAGSTCTPLSMITIGAMLSALPIKSMFNNVKVYMAAAIRLIIFPVLILLLLRYVFGIQDTLLIAIPVIVAGMPVASNAAMMAKEYNNNAELASQIILISTLFSGITIPFLAYLL